METTTYVTAERIAAIRVDTTGTILPSAFCLLPFAFCLLPSAFCLLPFAFCLLPSLREYPSGVSLLSGRSSHGPHAFVPLFGPPRRGDHRWHPHPGTGPGDPNRRRVTGIRFDHVPHLRRPGCAGGVPHRRQGAPQLPVRRGRGHLPAGGEGGSRVRDGLL